MRSTRRIVPFIALALVTACAPSQPAAPTAAPAAKPTTAATTAASPAAVASPLASPSPAAVPKPAGLASPAPSPSPSPSPVASGVTAELRTPDGQVVGTATFTQESAGVRVMAQVRNLPPGTHGIHVHEVGRCEGPDFTSAGAHFNPTTRQHGIRNPAGPHAGDLPNLDVESGGSGRMDALARDLTLGSGPTSVFDPDGSALVIHANADDEMTDPSGNSGGRIACGVIRRS